MTKTTTRVVSRGGRDERGIALIIVMIVMMIMTMLTLITFNQAVQQLPLARHDQDHESALHAAESGVDDYINHLNATNNYWLYTTTPTSPDANLAFSSWVAVPGPTSNESYRYSIDNTATASTGIVTVTASGKSRNVVRTVRVGLRKLGFLDYLYMTDYEIIDLALSGDNPASCQFHAWEYNPSTHGYGPDLAHCSVVFWTSQSTLNGAAHTNDGLYICGSPVFNGNIDTYYNSPVGNSVVNSTKFVGTGKVLNPNSCTNTPVLSRANDPASGSFLALPPGNTAIDTQADGALGGTGCLYTGPTTIALHFTGTTGFMDVTSPTTKVTNAGCGPGNNLHLPVNGVVYVQNIPAALANPNHSSCSGAACYGDVQVSNAATAGGLLGQMTIAAADDIIVTGNITYHTYPSGTDVLGLIALNDIAIQHPVNSDGSNATGTLPNLTIDAAILSLAHSFYVQNWDSGAPLGLLTVNGSIAQKYRGPVGTFSGNPPTIKTGYNKAYTYDPRLKYLTPPYFLSPLQSAWTHNSFSELKPAF